MAKKKKSNKFGWTSSKSWNRADKTHEEKNESAHYSFKQPKKARPKKLWCQPGDLNTTIRGKREGQKGRPYGYKPIYDQTETYNYKSDSVRLNKAQQIAPELKIGRVLFYRASDDCYWHVVIPPDITHEEFIEDFCKYPPDFFKLVLPEFWLNYPRPTTPTPGQPLFPNCPERETPDYNEPDNPDRPSQPNKPPVLGCMDLTAENFNPEATIDDGSCIWDEDKPPDELCPNGYTVLCKDEYANNPCALRKAGCTDPEAVNYDECASYNDGSCEYLEGGCTDPIACNYDPNAQVDNGSCIYPSCWPPCDEENRTPTPYQGIGSIVDCALAGRISSCQDPCEEPPEEPQPPAECVRQPEKDCRWITVSKEVAESGGGCSGEFHNINHGYAELSDGKGGSTYKVLCCGATPPADTKDSYWIDDGSEDSPKQITAAPDGGLSVCCDKASGTWVGENKDGIIKAGTGCPEVFPTCEKPSGSIPGFSPQDCPDNKWKPNVAAECGCIKSVYGKYESKEQCESSLETWDCKGDPDRPREPGVYRICAKFVGDPHRWESLPNFGAPVPYNPSVDVEQCVEIAIPSYGANFGGGPQWRFTTGHERFVTYNFIGVASCRSRIYLEKWSLNSAGETVSGGSFLTGESEVLPKSGA